MRVCNIKSTCTCYVLLVVYRLIQCNCCIHSLELSHVTCLHVYAETSQTECATPAQSETFISAAYIFVHCACTCTQAHHFSLFMANVIDAIIERTHLRLVSLCQPFIYTYFGSALYMYTHVEYKTLVHICLHSYTHTLYAYIPR